MRAEPGRAEPALSADLSHDFWPLTIGSFFAMRRVEDLGLCALGSSDGRIAPNLFSESNVHCLVPLRMDEQEATQLD